MKWFKHISDSLDDPFIFDLITKHGADGYLVFFGILEIYAREFKPDPSWNLSVSLSYLKQKFYKTHKQLITNPLQTISNSGKWKVSVDGDKITIFIPKFRELLDEYTIKKLSKNKQGVGTVSGQSPKNIRIELDRDKDKDKDIKEKVLKKEPAFVLPDWIPQETWNAYMEVRNKKKAAKTPYALSLIIKELIKIKEKHGHDPVTILNKSIKSGWTDVYPLKDENKTQQQPSSRTPPITRLPEITPFPDDNKVQEVLASAREMRRKHN